MVYKVEFLPDVQRELNAIYLASGLDDYVFDAIVQIEICLRTDAHNVGESRTGSIRIMFESPLGAYFYVDWDHSYVLVVQVWRFKTNSP